MNFISHDVCYWIVLGLSVITTGIVAFCILPKSKNGKLNPFFQFVHDLCNFKKFYVEGILKCLYAFCTIYSIVYGVFFLFDKAFSLLPFMNQLAYCFLYVAGLPIIIRLVYELCMLVLTASTNINEINNKLNNKEVDNTVIDSDTKLLSAIEKNASNAYSSISQKIDDLISKKGKDSQPQQPQQPAQEGQVLFSIPADTPQNTTTQTQQPTQTTQPSQTEAKPIEPQQPAQPVQPAESQPQVEAKPAEKPAEAQQDARFCANCGNKIASDSKFCPVCGKQQ